VSASSFILTGMLDMAETAAGLAEAGLTQPAASLGMPLLRAPAIENMPRHRLRQMLAAGREAQECRRALEKGGLNLVGEILRGQGEFVEYNHYPENDVYDEDTRAQYYYHAHRGLAAEHGHFHTFLRRPGALIGAAPVTFPASEPWPQGNDEIAHLVAIAMDAYGWPIGLFTTNRWVTGETWFRATDVIRMLDRFRIDHANPSWPVNRWLGAMVGLYRPHIETLLIHRDAVIAAWRDAHPGTDVFEDRALEITGQLDISVDAMVRELQSLLGATDAGINGR
jgi:hypothetical protein